MASTLDLEIVRAEFCETNVPAGCTRMAAAQLDAEIGAIDANVDRMVRATRQAAAAGAQLIVAPECALTGYCFADADEARANAVASPDALTPLLALTVELGVSISTGYLERRGDDLLNAAVLLADGRVVAKYHKAHLPHLGVDRYVTRGCAKFEVAEAAGLRMGMQICYDGSFPEATRLQALAGADLVLLPTNWPAEAILKADWLPNTRAYENVIYFAAINRVGEERGFTFPGRSRVCDPTGATLVQGPDKAEALLVCDIDPSRARTKRIERRADYYLDRIGDRRTDLYELREES